MLKVTSQEWCQKSRNLQPLDVLACKSANKPSFQNLFAKLQAKMSRSCRFLLFWHHSYDLTLRRIWDLRFNKNTLSEAIGSLEAVARCNSSDALSFTLHSTVSLYANVLADSFTKNYYSKLRVKVTISTFNPVGSWFHFRESVGTKCSGLANLTKDTYYLWQGA